jgi:hypothetical protein
METINSNDLLKTIRKNLVFIFFYQTGLLLLVFLLFYVLNFTTYIPIDNHKLLNSVLFGLAGSLIYFSRKTYVYLITSKLYNIVVDSEPDNTSKHQLVLTGYYLYLIFRPFVGIIIGPLIFMMASIGLVSFVKSQVQVSNEFSKTGEYFIYLLSFFSGHASSDMFDYFSKLAKKITVKEIL